MIEGLKPLVKILSGTGGAQLLALLALPVISRFYTPADFGIFGIGLAIATLVTTVSSLQLHNAIILPRIKASAYGLHVIASAGSIVGGLVTAVVLWGVMFISTDVSYVFLTPSFILLVGMLVAVAGVAQSYQAIAVREKAFGAIGSVSIIRVILISGMQYGLAIHKAGFEGLLAAQVFGEFLVCLCFIYLGKQSDWIVRPPSLKRLRALVRVYRSFVTYGTAQESMMAASQGAPLWILGHYYGGSISGYYSFANKVLIAPATLVGNAVRQVYSRRFAEKITKRDLLRREFFQTTALLAMIFLPLSAVIAPFAEDIFVFSFGASWAVSGEYAQSLIFWVVMGVCNAPATVIFRVTKRQKESFYYNVALLLLRVLLLVVGGMYMDSASLVVSFVVLGVFMNFAYIWMAWRCI